MAELKAIGAKQEAPEQKQINDLLRSIIPRVNDGEVGGVVVLLFDANGMHLEDDLAGMVVDLSLNAACDDIKFELAYERNRGDEG